jgi:hemoglobin
MNEPSLYERLGGAFPIAAVIENLSDAVVRNPIAGNTSENPQLREWSTNDLVRLPGLMAAFAAHRGEVNAGYCR